MPDSLSLRNWLAVFAVALGFFVVMIDTTAVNVAVDAIGSEFNAKINGQQWVLVGYTLSLASLLLAGGALGDLLGNRRIYIAGVIWFVVASVFCALARTLGVLVAARLGQGVGAAMLMPCSLAILPYAFPDARQRARAVGIWASIASTALIAGPLVGGLLIAAFGWRSIFWINVPLGIVAAVLARVTLPVARGQGTQRLNIAAQTAGAATFALASFVLIEGHRRGWASNNITLCAALALVALLAFLILESVNTHPVVPRHLWSHGAFVTAAWFGFFCNYTFYGLVFVLSLYYQQSLHLKAIGAGLAFLPMTIGVSFANYNAGRLNARYGPRPGTLLGPICSLTGLTLLSVAATRYPRLLPFEMVLVGFGGGTIVPTVTAVALESIPKEVGGIASGIFNTCRQMGSTVGVAVFGTVLAVMHGDFPASFRVVWQTAGIGLLIGLILSRLFFRPRQPVPIAPAVE